jgi:hypothetical protein
MELPITMDPYSYGKVLKKGLIEGLKRYTVSGIKIIIYLC